MRSLAGVLAWGWLALAPAARAGIAVQSLGTVSPADLAQVLVGQGVTISNVTYQGISWGAGKFYGAADILGFDAGVVLTTGSVHAIPGPNWTSQVSHENNEPGDAQLDLLAGTPTRDAASLEFDFVTSTTDLNLEFVFASDEYNEFLGAYNDVFAFYLDGVNVALVPGTTLPVTVNTVNGSQNAAYYLNNDASTTIFLDTQFDGVTRVLQMTGTLTAGVPHHIKFVIADGADDDVDSAVFLRAGSFTALAAGLVVRKTATPFVAAGDPLTFTIAVENIGDGTAYSVEAWDTIPAGTTLTALPPPGVNNAGILVWSLGDLGPHASVEVTFTVLVNGGMAAVVNRVGGLPTGGYGLCNGSGGVTLIPYVSIYSEPMATQLERPIPCLSLRASTTNFNAACPGTVVQYELRWANCGRQTIDGLTLTDTLPAGATWVGGSLASWAAPDDAGQPLVTVSEWAPSSAGPWTAGEPPDGTTAPALARWVVDRVAPGHSGAIRFDMIVGASPPDDVVVNRGWGTATGDPVPYPVASGLATGPLLAQWIANSVTVIEVGAPLLLNLKAQNIGCRQAVEVTVSVWGDSGEPPVVAMPAPHPVLLPGEWVSFTVTITATRPGPFSLGELLGWTNTATGIRSGDTAAVPRRMAFEGPRLSARLAAPGSGCAGLPRLLCLTVSNSGNTPAVGVQPRPPGTSGPGSTTAMIGPWPPGPRTLNPGTSVVFSWTVTGWTPGAVTWSVTVDGASGLSGYLLYPRTASATGYFTGGGSLAAALAAPASAWVGDWVTVTLTVTETGGDAVSVGPPRGPVSPLFEVRAGPVPPGPVALGPNATATWTWTVSVSGSGTVGFSVTVPGTNCAGLPLTATAFVACAVPRPATLTGRLQLSTTTAVVGEPVTVVLTVTNTGVSDSLGTISALGWTGPPAVLISGPTPGVAVISAGGTVSFTWTLSVSGGGILNLSATAQGTDSVGGRAVPCPPATAILRVLTPAALAVEIIQLLPSPVPSGAPLSGLARIRNTGERAATVFIPASATLDVPAGTAGPPVLAGPPAAVRVEGGAAVDFVWSLTTAGCGQVRLAVTATGVEAATGRVLGPVPATALPALVTGVPARLVVTPDAPTAVCGANAAVTAVLTDNCGNPVAGQAVSFSVDRGGTAIRNRTVITDANGRARADLALGYDPGPTVVSAALAGGGVTASCVINVTLPRTALDSPGAALDRNVFEPRGGNDLMIRLYPRTPDPVTVRIYGGAGRQIRVLGTMVPVGGGRSMILWDGRNTEGDLVTPGVYLVRVGGGGLNDTLKVVVR